MRWSPLCDGIEEGMTFSVQHVTEEVRDPKTGEVVDEIAETVGGVKIVEVKEKTAYGKITYKTWGFTVGIK